MNTASTNSVWITESRAGRQAAYAVLGAAVGVALYFGSRRAHDLESITSISALLLSLLILAISIVVLVRGGKQVIIVDSRKRHITIEDISRFGSKKRMIPFSLITDVYVGELGDREGGSISYHVVAKLNSGKEVALFIGAFEGAYDKSAMEGRCRRLADCLQKDMALPKKG